jgi:two-component system, OmpR family, response regulator
MKLLLIEDNAALATRMKKFLHQQFVVDIAQTGDQALRIIDQGVFDVIILVVCQRLRDIGVSAPILVVTGDDQLMSRVSLLNAGADDFVIKPFHADEIKARLAALLRRPPLPQQPSLLTYVDLEIDLGRRTVTRAGVPIRLRRKEFDILEYLVRHHDHVVTRDMILNHVWDSRKANSISVVDVHIKRLRDQIDRPFPTTLIKTAYGLGYRVDAIE